MLKNEKKQKIKVDKIINVIRESERQKTYILTILLITAIDNYRDEYKVLG